ncbi:MAG: NAD(P)/FAD-dependent oxidoreductase [Candidatus Flexifilum sp.]|jgi:glycine/D-amino acid oxidase-like deaminating enzyme
MSVSSHADVLIVGGGIIGAAIAYSLTQRQFGRVMLVDRGHFGMGTTGSSVASIEPLTTNPAVAALQAESIATFKDFEARIGGECGFNRLPVALFVSEHERPAVARAVECARRAGSDAAELTPEAFAALYPCIDVTGVGTVFYSQDGGFADPMLTLHSFLDGARRAGAILRQHTPVVGICVAGGRVIGVETPDGPLYAPIVVLAPGLWVEALLRPLGLTASIYLHRHFVFSIQAPPDAPRLSMLDTPLEFYARPEQSGDLFLVGGAGIFPPCQDPDEAGPGVPLEQMYTYLERLVTRLPLMETAGLRASTAYTGVADMTPDQQPLLGELPIAGLYLAAGMSGIGFKMSPGIGHYMAALIAGDEDVRRLLHPLRPTRFSEGAALTDEFMFPLD